MVQLSFYGTDNAVFMASLNYIYLLCYSPVWIYGLFNNRMIMGIDIRPLSYLHYLFCIYYLINYYLSNKSDLSNKRTTLFMGNIILWGCLWLLSYHISGTITPYIVNGIDIMDPTIFISLLIPILINLGS